MICFHLHQHTQASTRIGFPLHVEVSACDEGAAAAITAAGGRVTRVYYTGDGLKGLLRVSRVTLSCGMRSRSHAACALMRHSLSCGMRSHAACHGCPVEVHRRAFCAEALLRASQALLAQCLGGVCAGPLLPLRCFQPVAASWQGPRFFVPDASFQGGNTLRKHFTPIPSTLINHQASN